ncbi:MAG TPA: peptidoglycan-associated lipoprotein Pal [Candidatus Acidoferrales bacterium]|nr:peptidoglycan-associated lipoprotein Pal [Candidatus Acidoferrales bacterium]
MKDYSLRQVAMVFCLAGLALLVGGCKKQVGAAPPAAAPAPAPAQPTVTINASTTSINPGEAVTLTWSSTDATDLNLAPGVGRVAPSGTTTVTPAGSTTYQITANGPGGSATASVRVTVAAAAAEAPPAAQPGMDELFRQNVQDAYYDFNKSDLRADARSALTRTAEFLRSYPQIKVSIEGHCDERGSTEYNLGLGERRAQAARDFLIQLGIPTDRMTTVSYGKEQPFCSEHTETCWQQNRRAHFVRSQ